MGNFYQYAVNDPRCMDDAKYLVVWGANPVENQHRLTRHIVEAKSRGAKIVDIGLLYDATAGYADWFIPVKPGTDCALSLCMAQQIIEKNLHKPDFLCEHTVAPYLVRDDDNLFMRDGEGNYIVWDADADSPVAQAPGVKALAIEHPVLSGEFEIFGVSARPPSAAWKSTWPSTRPNTRRPSPACPRPTLPSWPTSTPPRRPAS